MARNDEPKAEGEAVVAEAADSPLLDLTDAAVKRLIKVAKKRGWVTQEELNAVLPSEEISSDQIEDMNAMLSEMGINVVESEDAITRVLEDPISIDLFYGFYSVAHIRASTRLRPRASDLPISPLSKSSAA